MMSPNGNVESSDIGKVVANGYCIGCGACVASLGRSDTIKMVFDEYGLYKPNFGINTVHPDTLDEVCPFSNKAKNEDELGHTLFSSYACDKDQRLGFVYKTYAGYVKTENFRDKGSSGGMGSWLATRMMQQNIIDAVIHVRASNDNGKLFEYCISHSVDDIRQGSKSRYYPITLDQVMTEVSNTPKRYLFIGIPCFVKAVRLLARQNEIIASRIVACIGLVCGHLKTKAFAESLAWQVGITPDNLSSFDFRKKLPDSTADSYGIEACGRVGEKSVSRIAPVRSLFGHDWGWGVFKPKACDFCDDVVAETADITIGDAWLPRYVADHQGTNVIIIRNPLFETLLQDAFNDGLIHIEPLTIKDVIQTQSSGFNHRREGLAYRLWAEDQKMVWRPTKRVVAIRHVNDCGRRFASRQELRIKIREISHESFLQAKVKNNINIYKQSLYPVIERYRNINRGFLKSVIAKVRFFVFGFKI